MKPERLVSGLVLGLLLVAAPAFAQGNVQKLKTDEIAKAMGKEGDLTGDMYKVSFPRSDLTVNVGNVSPGNLMTAAPFVVVPSSASNASLQL